MEFKEELLVEPVRIIVLGAGYAGSSCVAAIEKKLKGKIPYEISVLERRQTSVHKMAAARAVTLGEVYAERVLVPNQNLVSSGKTIHKEVEKVTENEIILKSGEIMKFDFLICATGSVHASVCEPPTSYVTRKTMRRFYNQMATKIQQSQKIVIVGGGPPGCELAAEIKSAHQDKNVTIVHSGERLCSKLSPAPSAKFYKLLHKKLETLGVDLKLNQRLDLDCHQTNFDGLRLVSGENEYFTSTGEKVEADLVLICAGVKIVNEMYPSEWLDQVSGQMVVRSTFKILNHDHIFAVGDLNNVKENKQAATASRQGTVAGQNVANLVLGSKTLKKYSPGQKTYVSLAVGQEDGVAFLGYATFGGKFVKKWKSRDLKTKEMWRDFNVADKIPTYVPDDYNYFML